MDAAGEAKGRRIGLLIGCLFLALLVPFAGVASWFLYSPTSLLDGFTRSHSPDTEKASDSQSGGLIAQGTRDAKDNQGSSEPPPPKKPLLGPAVPAPVVLKDHANAVRSLSWSPDGKQLATGVGQLTGAILGAGQVKVWDPNTGQEIITLLQRPCIVQGVAFSPNGKLLAAVVFERTQREQRLPVPPNVVEIWDVATSRKAGTLKCRDPEGFSSLAFSPDSKRLATGSHNGRVTLWDLTTYQETLTVREPSPRNVTGRIVQSMAFSPDGARLAATIHASVVIWDAATGKEDRTLLGHTWETTSVCFSPDSKLVASSGSYGTVRVWDPATGRKVFTFEVKRRIYSVAFSSDSKLLAAGLGGRVEGAAGQVTVWDARSGEEVLTLEPEIHQGQAITGNARGSNVLSVSFSPENKRLAGGCSDGTVWLWTLPERLPGGQSSR